MQGGLTLGVDESRHDAWWHTAASGRCSQWGDRAWSSEQAPFLVTETNAQSISGPWENHPPYPGQIKQAALALLARGGRMVEYWHWHTLHFGTETYWGGVLPHSRRPGPDLPRGRRRSAPTSGRSAPRSTASSPTPTCWCSGPRTRSGRSSSSPPLAMPDGVSPDTASYQRIFDAHYRGLFETGAQIRSMHVRQFAAADPARARPPLPRARRRRPVRRGRRGARPRSAPTRRPAATSCSASAPATATSWPARGVAVAPARPRRRGRRLVRRVLEPRDDPCRSSAATAASSSRPVPAGVEWVDVLQVDGAEVLARFAPTELGADAALATRAFGAGRITTVPTKPNAELSRSLARWLVPATARRRLGRERRRSPSRPAPPPPAAGSCSSRTGPATPTTVTAPSAATDLVSGATYAAGDVVPLEPTRRRRARGPGRLDRVVRTPFDEESPPCSRDAKQ